MSIWDITPAGFNFIGVTRAGRGTAFQTKPSWNDAAGIWVDLTGLRTCDLGLMMDAIPHDQQPALMIRPPQDLSAARHTQDPTLIKNLVGHSADGIVIDEKADVTELPKPPPGMVSDLNVPKATHFPPDAPTVSAMQLVRDREAARVTSVPKTMLVETKTNLVNAEAAWAEGTALRPREPKVIPLNADPKDAYSPERYETKMDPQLVPMPVVQDRTCFGAPKPHVPEAVQELRNNGGKLSLSTVIGEGIPEARERVMAQQEMLHHSSCQSCGKPNRAVEELEPSDDKGVITEVVTPKPGTGKLMGVINPPKVDSCIAQGLNTEGLVLGRGQCYEVVCEDPALKAIADALELLAKAIGACAHTGAFVERIKTIRAAATKIVRES